MSTDALPRHAEKITLTRHRRSLDALTGIRFLAAVYVVLFHSRLSVLLAEHGHVLAGNFIGNGYLAVPMFFLLSGFILAYTYSGQIETGRHRVRFYQARFARIWPMYVVSLLCCSFTTIHTPSPGLVAAHLLMVQSWNPLHPEFSEVWNPVCWTLSTEAFFYLCFPWVQTWLERLNLRSLRWMAAILLVLPIAANTTPRVAGVLLYGGIFRFLPVPVIHLPEFLLGVALGNLYLKAAIHKPTQTYGLCTYAGLVAAVVAALGTPRGPWISTSLFGMCFLLYGLATERTHIARFLSSKTLVLGGGISYSVYLLQIPVILWVVAALLHAHIQSSFLHMAATLVFLVLLSLATFLGVEEPLRKLLRSRFSAWDRARDAKTL